MLADLDKKYRNHELPANRHLSVFFDENAEGFENLGEITSARESNAVYAQGDANNNQEKALYNILRTFITSKKNILDEHIILYSDKELVRNVFHQEGIDKLEKIAEEKNMSVKELQEKHLYDEEIEALRAAGYNVIGMVASYTYGFPVAEKAFADANVRLVTLTNYEAVVEVAKETGYIKAEHVPMLAEWRANPSEWKK